MDRTLEELRSEAEVVVHGSHFLVEEVARCALVIATRTSLPFESLLEAEATHEEITRYFPYLRERWNLLLDLREAPMRTDPAFERVIRRHRPEMIDRFASHAVLVKTAVGTLQVTRHTKESRTETLVTTSASKALRYLGVTGVITTPPAAEELAPSSNPPQDE